MPNLRVYLVDDHPLMRMALRRILESGQRFVVVGASDTAEDCLTAVAALGTDMVVMDIQLPGIDGVEATRRLKSQDAKLKVVIVSAYGEEYLISSIDARAEGYMMKGPEPKAMIEGLFQAAEGTPPIDSNLTRLLMDRAAAGPREHSGPSLSDLNTKCCAMFRMGCRLQRSPPSSPSAIRPSSGILGTYSRCWGSTIGLTPSPRPIAGN